MCVPHVSISPYNKHANGVVERGHSILREAIVKMCDKDNNGQIKNWHKHVDAAVFADQVTISGVTGFSPYYLLHGVHLVLPFDLFEATFLVEDLKSNMTTTELLALHTRQIEKRPEDLAYAPEILKKARLQSKAQFKQRYARCLQKYTYKERDLVLVRNTRLEMTVTKFKTDPHYIGPYEIVRRTPRGNYVSKELDRTIHVQPYAAFRIITYIH
jgi:hypothetical protein